jgi:hypothetical protein
LEWRRCLQQVQERGGALEIAVLRHYDRPEDAAGSRLVWRVRLLEVSTDEIVVEPPTTLGEVIRVETGIEFVAILALGQNRWMFTTSHLGPTEHSNGNGRAAPAMRLRMPDSVERCQRRNYYRMETTALVLPQAEVWPLLDPKSVLPAERANELQFEDDRNGVDTTDRPAPTEDDAIMPEVGPKFTATLLNIGGGGLGLRVAPEDAQSLARHKVFWLRFSMPGLATPICATGKLAHTNVDSTQHTYAGLAFDFSFNPVHQRFVVEQICRFIEIQQQGQLDDRGTQQRKSA